MQTTCKAYSPIIILAQCFGMLPISNVRSEDINQLKFTWKSIRFLYAIIVILLLLLNLFFYIVRTIEMGLTFNTTVVLLFFAFGPVSAILLMQLTTKWPGIMRQWTQVDNEMLGYGFPKNMKRNVYTTTVLVMGASLVEHSFFMAFSLSNAPEIKNAPDAWTGLHLYLKVSGSHVFDHIPYNPFFGFVFKLIDVTITFVWNYIDMFIMTIAIGLAARFKQINNKIMQIVDAINNNTESCSQSERNVDGAVWMNIREDYNRLCQLTAVIDNAMKHIVLLSFANNLFLILVQLLHSIEPQEKTRVVDRLYFAYSFSFLILRTSAVAMTSSQIYVESRRPSWYLTTQLPEEYYDDEVERLLMEIRATGGCCLTGDGFFKVKSSLILSIAGAIVSYELILIQFNLLS